MTNRSVLLLLLPYWTPLVPPLAQGCLKSFLQREGYPVTTADANIEEPFMEIYNRYFETLREHIPPEKHSNFFNIGHEVLRNHQMAYFTHHRRRRPDHRAYTRFLEELVAGIYYHSPGEAAVKKLDDLIAEFYQRLERYVLDRLAETSPSVLGISVFRGTLPASLFAFQTAKERYPHLETVMGGGIFADQLAPGSPDLQRFLEAAPYIDKMLVGEGEHLFLRFLQDRLPDTGKVCTLRDLDGLLLDLEEPPIPDFSDLKHQAYPMLGAYTSRACYFNCTFCSETVHWGRYRKKPTGRVVEELTELSARYGRRLFLMGDSLLNPVVSGLSGALAETGASLYWDGYLRADDPVRSRDNTMQWRHGGFYRARLGVESGSPRVLEWMGKKITPQHIEEAVRSLAYAGIKTTTYWVVGYPGETEDDFRQTLDLVERLKDDIYEAEANPFWFFPAGQVNSGGWEGKQAPLFPGTGDELLLLKPRVLECEPSREVIYQRLNRFVQHCRALGVPNPYTRREIHDADQRWLGLQKNAVPPLKDMHDENLVRDESKDVRTYHRAEQADPEDGDFSF